MEKPKILRSEVVQTFLNHFDAPRYLEVGVAQGKTFFNVSAARKVAVDPVFKFDPAAQDDPTAEFCQIPSDDWFHTQAVRPIFDVIYLDGLHTAEQTLRDLMNAVDRLEPNGVIIIDDVIPCDAAAALPDQDACYEIRDKQGNPSKAWMGDVFRLLYFIETFMPAWTVKVVEENHGQAVMWREPRATVMERSLVETAAKGFDDLVNDGRFLRTPLADIDRAYGAFRASIAG